MISANIKEEQTIMLENDVNFIKNINREKLIRLDVRPIINNGKDPFHEIMSVVKTLKDDNVFLLINSFEPIPLYSIMKKKGYDYTTLKEEEVYKVYFSKNISESNNTIKKSEDKIDPEQERHDFDNIIEVDVRDLEPPEPMVKILETLTKVDGKTVLVVHHHREPVLLYPILKERGYTAISNEINDSYYKIIIMKQRD